MVERVLITGGRGFVGSRLCSMLNEAHPEWVVSSPGAVAGDSHPYLDVTDEASVDNLVKSLEPTSIVHLAAVSAVTDAARAPRHSWRVNLAGTMNLTAAILRQTPKCRFLFVSSAEVYGQSLVGGPPYDETMVLKPTNAYAASKAAADIHVRQQVFEGLEATVVRPFNHIGPGQSSRFAIPSFASQIALIERGESAPVIKVGSLDDERDFLDVDDVVAAYLKVLEMNSSPPGLTMNIASGKSRRIGDILDILLSKAKVKIEIQLDQSRLRPEGVTCVVGNASFARKILNWSPRKSIDETVHAILNYERKRFETNE